MARFRFSDKFYRYCSVFFAVLIGATSFQLLSFELARAEPRSAITAFVSNNGGSDVFFQEVGNTASLVTASSRSVQNRASPAASLYKLFVAQFMYQRASSGNLNLDASTTISYSQADKTENGLDGVPDSANLPWENSERSSGNGNFVATVTYRACLRAMLIYSDNVCGSAMQRWANGLGIDSYLNSQGYGNTTLSGSDSTTARDVGELMLKIAGGTFVNANSSQDIYGILRQQYHRSKIPAGLPTATEIGNKTGERHDINYSHDAAIIKINGKTYVLAVLTALDPDVPETAQKIAQLAADIFDQDSVNPDGSASGSCVTQEYSGAGSESIYKVLQRPFYDSQSGLSCNPVCGDSSSPGDFSGDTDSIDGRERIVYNFLSQMTINGQKMNLIQVAGALGNLKHESMGYNPRAENSAGYYGLAQWSPNGRLPLLKNFALQNGLQFDTFEAQLRFIQEELTNNYRNSTWLPILQATTVIQASDIWQDNYEGTGAGREQRRRYAQEAYDRFSRETAGSNQTPTSQGSNCENGGMVNTEGYHYPVAPLRQNGDVPAEGHAAPIYAYDFMRPGGTAVYAVFSGTIGRVNENYSMPGYPPVPGCTSINLNGDDGWKYWYGHMMNPLVQENTPVVAGQKIAEVADFGGTACYGGGMHVHLDRGYPKGEPGGWAPRDDPDFIPFLLKLYNELPGASSGAS